MDKNFDWKYNGPVEIINVLGLTEGTIVAVDQRDRFEKTGKVVWMISPHEYLSESQSHSLLYDNIGTSLCRPSLLLEPVRERYSGVVCKINPNNANYFEQ